jgi:hypothetical protein
VDDSSRGVFEHLASFDICFQLLAHRSTQIQGCLMDSIYEHDMTVKYFITGIIGRIMA